MVANFGTLDDIGKRAGCRSDIINAPIANAAIATAPIAVAIARWADTSMSCDNRLV